MASRRGSVGRVTAPLSGQASAVGLFDKDAALAAIEELHERQKANVEALNTLEAQLNKQLEGTVGKERQKIQDKIDKIQFDRKKYETETIAKQQEALQKHLDAKEKASAEERIKQEKKWRLDMANEAGAALGEKIHNALDTGVVDFNKVISNVTGALNGSVEKYLGTYQQYMAGINARIQGAGEGFNYESMNKIIKNNVAWSPFVRYTTVLEKLNDLIGEGIADNVMQRAFLASVSDKIATTFNATSETLLRIVRIQQKDTTAARLGMEAALTRLFNYYFSDTSYLTNAFDSVSDNLLELSAQLDSKTAVELEYQAQKWLGALGSVGVSSSFLSTLAEGISYLGTGNVDALSGNSALQNLLVMAASRTGLDYSSMLTGGVTAGNVNTLLRGVVSYVQDIAGSQNNVVKQQYAQLFGLTMADIAAFENLNDSVITDLYNSGMTYSDTIDELNSQLKQVSSRMHLSEKIDTLFDNMLAVTGMSVANNPALYGIWKAADMLESITGGINLPFISALGTGVDLNMSLEGLVKSGVVGFGTVAQLIAGITSLTNQGGMGAFDSEGMSSSWRTDLTKGGFAGYQHAGALSTTTSTTGYVSSGSQLGIQQSLYDTQTDTGKSVQGEEQTEGDTVIEILKFLRDYFDKGGGESKPLRVALDQAGDNNTVKFSENYPFSVTGSSNLGW